MARYVDADELLNRLPDDLPYKASVKRVLVQAPTADVVPKSEVEALTAILELNEKAYDSLRELYRADTDALVEARRKTEVEVVREIIGIIEQRRSVKENASKGHYVDFWKGVYRGVDYAYRDIKEILEQKHTEGKT